MRTPCGGCILSRQTCLDPAIRSFRSPHGDHLQFHAGTLVQRRHADGGTRRRILWEKLAVNLVERLELFHVDEKCIRVDDMSEVHAGLTKDLADVDQSL